MPAPIERGLEDLFSTIDVTGIRITLGKPIAQPNRDWARVHLLATSTDYYGKLRVILYNLRRGVPPDAAYRNAVAKTPVEIDRETDAYLAARNFPNPQVSPRPMSERDFTERAVEPDAARLALADLLLPDSRAAYQALIAEKLHVTEAHEGLALLALKAGDKEAARREFAAAIAAGNAGARCYLEYGRLEPDAAKALDALRHAVKLDPKLAEAHFLIARRETDPTRRLAALKSAAELNPRDAAWWQALAEEYLAQKDFSGAAKAWTAAEQAATDDASRARFLKSRLAIEQQRLDYEASERKRKADEEAREIEKLKAEARAEVRALEERVNRGEAPAEKVVPWWDGPAPAGRATGTLKQVDCLRPAARIVIDTGGKLLRLLIPDPARIAILGGGEQALGCGPQRPRRVTVEYFPKNNAKLGTAGEVATLQFQ
jgi:tetratricopeptide (TPR) repeat protein